MDKKLKAVRKKLLTDFPFYAKSALKIRTKEGAVAPLVLNPAQQILQDAIDKQMADEGQSQDNHSESPTAGIIYLCGRLSLLQCLTKHSSQSNGDYTPC